MDKEAALLQAKTLLTTGEKHYFYERVVNFAKEYEAHITGEGIEEYLKRYTLRETEEMFKQRVQLTNSINPAVTNSLMKPFYKVSRNNNVVKKYDFRDIGLNGKVAVMLNDFNGDKIDNTDGLENWLRTRFVELTFADPNSFVVIEWDATSLTQTIKPRPFEVSSAEAWNYEYKGQELQWLHVCTPIKFNRRNNGKTKAANGFKFTLYGQGWTIASEQIDREYLNAIGFIPAYNQFFDEVKGKTYLVSYYETKLNYVPAFRVGYARDLKTNGKTFVSPFHPAMTYLRKSLKTCSELDITMTGHVFPQKLQYIQKCNGVSPTETCNNGRCPTKGNAVCAACNGSGFKTITTAQEALYFPFPETKEEYLPLNDMLVYKSPPIDLVKFQDEYIRNLKQDTHLAVYNSNMFIASDAQFAKTATEIDSNMDGIYDAIEPYSEKYSKIWKLIVYTSAALGGFNLTTDDYDLLHAFPADPKLKTLSLLLSDLKTVNDSNAPSFTRDIINNDIAEIIYNGDDEAMKKYRVRHIFYPFNGKTDDAITMLLSSELVSEHTKILYANFEAIFSELERENKNFYDLKEEKQWELVDEKVESWRQEIVKNSVQISIPFGNIGGAGNAGDQTAGSNGEGDPETGSEGSDNGGAADPATGGSNNV